MPKRRLGSKKHRRRRFSYKKNKGPRTFNVIRARSKLKRIRKRNSTKKQHRERFFGLKRDRRSFDRRSFGMKKSVVLDNPFSKKQNIWSVIASYFRDRSLVFQHIDSYDRFIYQTIPEIIGRYTSTLNIYNKVGDRIKRRYRITFGRVSISKPTIDEPPRPLFPHEARIRNLNYSCPIYVEVKIIRQDFDKDRRDWVDTGSKKQNELLCMMPVMLRSRACNLSGLTTEERRLKQEGIYDHGGYFISNGQEKVIVSQERRVHNMVYCTKGSSTSPYEWTSIVSSQTSVSDNLTQPDSSGFSINLTRDGYLMVQIGSGKSGIKEQIPLFVIYLAIDPELSTIDPEEIVRNIRERLSYRPNDIELYKLLENSFDEVEVFLNNPRNALKFLINRIPLNLRGDMTESEIINRKKRVLAQLFLPHVGNDFEKKLHYLSYMTNRLLKCKLGRAPPDSLDNLGNKRVDSTGVLLGNMFSYLFKTMLRKQKRNFENIIKTSRLPSVIDYNNLTEGFNKAISQGVFGYKQGVSQVLERKSYIDTISHMRRIVSPVPSGSKLTDPRKLSNTHIGYICPWETPEGGKVGLLKNYALTSFISLGSSPSRVLEYLVEVESLDFYGPESYSACKVFINGDWIGFHYEPEHLREEVVQLRRSGRIFSEVSVAYLREENEIRIYTDPGRFLRPLLIVNRGQLPIKKVFRNKKLLYSWDTLVENGYIEYLDPNETNTEDVLISTSIEFFEGLSNDEKREYTHCELHPSLLFGICGSTIPYSDTNPSSRNTFSCAQMKQAIGLYATSYPERMDTDGKVLYYPQIPLAQTKYQQMFDLNDMPSGQNAIVAIMTFQGYNQEDSLIFSQSAIDRGLFRSTSYDTYKDEEEEYMLDRKGDAITSLVGKRVEGLTMNANYLKLGRDGLVSPGTKIKQDDALIGKITNDPSDLEDIFGVKKFYDISTFAKRGTRGVVDQVTLTNIVDDKLLKKERETLYREAKVRVRSIKIPKIGDKFSSRHGQKGTIGITFNQDDLPYTAEGIVPDIIMNPHALPTRMTNGHIIECLYSKLATFVGHLMDATPFDEGRIDIDEVLASILPEEDIAAFRKNQEMLSDRYVKAAQLVMEKLGYTESTEVLYHPHTGKAFPAKIYIGPTYYQRLKHLVDNKIYARPRGPMDTKTMQPKSGRSVEGGLRLGEMETDCLISYGAGKVIKDRLLESSDKFIMNICVECGTEAQVLENGQAVCRICGNSDNIEKIAVPYAYRLHMQELVGMGITPRLICKRE